MSSAQAPHFQIFVKGNRGKNTTLWVTALNSINDIKDKIALKDLIPAKEQRLVFNGREMLGERTLSDYHVRKNNTLFVVMRLRGGMDNDSLFGQPSSRPSLKMTGCLSLKVGWQR